MVLLRDVGHNRKNIQADTGCHSEPCPESNRRTCHETFGFAKDKSVGGGVMNPKNFLQYLFSKYINLFATRLRTLAYKLVMTVCFASLAMTLLFVAGANGDTIIKNELEDLNILISTVIGGQPNVLIIYDNSLSMGDNFGLDQLGNWDQALTSTPSDNDSIVIMCESFQSVNTNYAKAHCIGNASGTNPCGSTACTGSRTGTCEEPDDFERFLVCIETKYPTLFSSVYATVVPSVAPGNACSGVGTDPRIECTTDTERAHAAAAIENEALKQANTADSTIPLNCGAENCVADADKSCDISTEYTNYQSCMNSLRIQPTSTICANGVLCSKGIFGSTRMDMTQAAIFDLLDAADSLAEKMCQDKGGIFSGTVDAPISCQDFMYTPFRDVGAIAKG